MNTLFRVKGDEDGFLGIKNFLVLYLKRTYQNIGNCYTFGNIIYTTLRLKLFFECNYLSLHLVQI